MTESELLIEANRYYKIFLYFLIKHHILKNLIIEIPAVVVFRISLLYFDTWKLQVLVHSLKITNFHQIRYVGSDKRFIRQVRLGNKIQNGDS